ncbi:MAG: hypothetical protein AB8F94_01370 [Saprospiraceae bacterium]
MKKALKKRKIYDCVCDSEGAIVEKNLTNITYLDEKENVIREEIYNEGEIDVLVENTFVNELLQQIQQTDYVNQIQQTWEFIYDEFGRKIEQREHFQEGDFIPTKFEYTTEGKLKMEAVLDDDGEIESKIDYEYSSVGNLIKKVEYDTNDFTSPWVSTTYEYDINNKVVKKEEKFADKDATTSTFEYNEAGELIGGQIYYSDDEDLIVDQKVLEDENGKVIGTEIFNPKENIKRQVLVKRNETNEITEEEILINGNFNSLTVYNYNDANDVIEEKYLNIVGNGEFQQWTAKAYDLEYFESSAAKTEEE